MPKRGFEPLIPSGHQILSLICMPIPTLGLVSHPGFEPGEKRILRPPRLPIAAMGHGK